MKLFRTTDDATTDTEPAQDENGDTAMSQEPTAPDSDTRPVATGLARESDLTTGPDPTDQDAGTARYQDSTTYQDAAATPDQPQPTFTPAGETSAAGRSADSTPVPSVRPDPTDAGGDFTRPVAAVAPAYDETPANDETPAYDETPADSATPAYDEPVTAFPASSSAAPAAVSESAAAPAMNEPAAAWPADEPPAARPVHEPAAAFSAEEHLLADTTEMRASWQKVQAEFVDDPRAAVMGAADLIEQTAQSLVDALRQRQRQLRDTVTGDSAGSGSAAANGPSDTEHLRLMMQRYRTLFNQLCDA